MNEDPAWVTLMLDEMTERGWSPEQLAEQAGVNAMVIYDICRGSGWMTSLVAKALARAFGTSEELWINLGKRSGQC